MYDKMIERKTRSKRTKRQFPYTTHDRSSFGDRVGVADAGEDLGTRGEQRARVAARAECRIDVAFTGKDGERCDDFCTEDRIVAGIAGEKLGHLRPFPFVASHEAAKRRTTGSASAPSARAGSPQISNHIHDPTKTVPPARSDTGRDRENR